MSQQFRADIQALRAVAVAGVVSYHLWPRVVGGGFVGVDVFFVISGFLITQILVGELGASGRVRLAHFWARRIRRILPAAFTVLGACLLILVTQMARVTWPDNLAQIRASAAYFENWLLGAHSVNYLAAENSPSLVQHYWTLSVEEQFYLLWPLLIVAVALLGRHARPARRRAALLIALALITLASFVVSVLWTAADPAMAFFATPARGWEFGVGGVLGAITTWRGVTRRRGSRRVLGLGAGLALVGYSYAALNGHNAFPGWIAAIPVAGAVLVIAAEVDVTASRTTRVVGLPPVQWLGDNSYSIYLWHWPLIIAAPWVTHRSTTAADKVAILGLTLALAAVTKLAVEDPVRRGVRWRRRPQPAYALGLIGVTALVTASSLVNAGGQHTRTAERVQARARTRALLVTHHRSCFGAAAMVASNKCRRPYARPAHLDLGFAAQDGRSDPCLQHYDAATPSYCELGNTRAPVRTIALVGNSHAWRLIPALDLYATQHHWKLIAATRINCLGLVTAAVSNRGPSSNCLAWSAAVQEHLLATRHLDAVIFPSYRYARDYLAGTNANAVESDAAARQVLATWERFAAHRTRVIVTGDVPGMRPTNDPDCIAQSGADTDPCAVARSAVVRANLMSDLAQAHPSLAAFVPLTQYFCDAIKCHALIGGVVVYFDSHHLTATYSRSLARYLGAALAADLPHFGSPAST